MQRAKAILAAGIVALAVAAFAVLTVGYGVTAWKAAVAVAGAGAFALVEVLVDESSI